MRRERPAHGGAGNASQMGNLHQHSTAPAATNTARLAIGEIVHIYFIGRARVISHDHPEPMITLRTYAGVVFRCSRHQVIGLGVVE